MFKELDSVVLKKDIPDGKGSVGRSRLSPSWGRIRGGVSNGETLAHLEFTANSVLPVKLEIMYVRCVHNPASQQPAFRQRQLQHRIFAFFLSRGKGIQHDLMEIESKREVVLCNMARKNAGF